MTTQPFPSLFVPFCMASLDFLIIFIHSSSDVGCSGLRPFCAQGSEYNPPSCSDLMDDSFAPTWRAQSKIVLDESTSKRLLYLHSTEHYSYSGRHLACFQGICSLSYRFCEGFSPVNGSGTCKSILPKFETKHHLQTLGTIPSYK